MASYKKYIVMGVSALLIPLLKNLAFQMISRYIERVKADDSEREAVQREPTVF